MRRRYFHRHAWPDQGHAWRAGPDLKWTSIDFTIVRPKGRWVRPRLFGVSRFRGETNV